MFFEATSVDRTLASLECSGRARRRYPAPKSEEDAVMLKQICIDGKWYESQMFVNPHGSQTWFHFAITREIGYSPSNDPAISVKYGKCVVHHKHFQDWVGTYPRVFVGEYEYAGAFNNRF